MSRIRLDRVLVVDFEETCWEGEPPPGQRSEIIEIGIVEVMLEGEPTVGRRASHLVRPTSSEVSPFCTALTGIDPAEVRRCGRPLLEVCNRIRKEFGGAAKTWAAWGRDDRTIARDCAALGVSSPFSDSYIDLGQLYGLLSGAEKAVGLSRAMSELGMAFEGTPHRAGDDALNAANVLVRFAALIRAHRPVPIVEAAVRP